MIEATPRAIGGEPLIDPSDPEASEVCDFFAGPWVVAVQKDLVAKNQLDAKDQSGLFDSPTCAAYQRAYKEPPTASNLVKRYVPPDHYCLSVRTGCLPELQEEEEPPLLEASGSSGTLFLKSFAGMLLLMGGILWYTGRKKKRTS